MADMLDVNAPQFRYFQRRQRAFRERTDHLNSMDSEDLRARYRFGLPALNHLFNLIKPRLTEKTNRNHSISKEMQILIALRYYATGDHQSVIGDTFSIHKSTVSRSIEEVTEILASMLNDHVRWPNAEQKRISKSEFYQIAEFPAVVGCVDGTHVRIKAPTEYEADYVNRKRYHSINVQAVCDHAGRFTNVVAKWPGSTHDSHIFRSSRLCHRLERTCRSIEDGVLLGDSGYGCRSFLITPFLRPSRACEERFNVAHKKTRSLIEQVFGRWKSRFRCLRSEMRFTPGKACRVILACAVLHQIAVRFHEPDVEQQQVQVQADIQERQVDGRDGRRIRNRIAEVYFS